VNSSFSGRPSQSLAALQAELADLAEHCPVQDCQAHECPLHQLRHLGAHRRSDWFELFSREELEYFACYHHACLLAGLNLQNVNNRVTNHPRPVL
jgi:hypothetical protein